MELKDTSKLLSEMTEIQKESFNKLKKSDSWKMLGDFCDKIIKKYCDYEKIDETLDGVAFKSEFLARKKSKQMFTEIFNDVEDMGTIIEKSKTKYV